MAWIENAAQWKHDSSKLHLSKHQAQLVHVEETIM